MGKSSSVLIIQFLSTNQPANVQTLSKKLNLTKADIRYHLKALIKSGTVFKIDPVEFSGIRGRPAAKYTVSSTSLPNNFSELLEILLLNPINQDVFAYITEKIIPLINLSYFPSNIEKLNGLIKELNDRNYDARWETRNDGPIIFISNCPYRSLLKKFPEFCKMDKIIISESIGKSIDHKNSFLEGTSCSFQIKFFDYRKIKSNFP